MTNDVKHPGLSHHDHFAFISTVARSLWDEPTVPQPQVRIIATFNLASMSLTRANIKSGYKATMLILDFPKEVQSEIFTFAHRDNSNDETLLLPVEVILSHVCSEWRNIAINLPFLWTAFKFETRRRASPWAVAKLQEYLVRSKKQLLELYFDMWARDLQGTNQCFKLVEIAIAHACRWRRFTLFNDLKGSPTGVTGSLRRLSGLRQLNAPNLEYFAMCLASEIALGDDEDVSPSVLIEGAPKLSVIRIDTTSHFHSMPPLSNITTLTIQESPWVPEYLYSFHTFRSILMIPTLTNLSIESSLIPHTRVWGNPATLPRIVMPSLKTLRITQEDNTLVILQLLDATLLETLVLHDLDLTSLYIGQDMNKITPFKKLDTLAILDCRYDPRGEEVESVNFNPLDSVGNILCELACCAKHVILSSPNAPSLIERGLNLFNLEKHKWPRLQCITLDLSTFSGLMFCLKNFEHSPHSLTVRVVEPVLEHWREVQLDSLMILEKVCKLEAMKAGDLMMDEYWPAPGGIFHEDGNLDIRWGESIRARGPVEE